MDFISCLDDCGLVDAGYSGNTFTWTNGRKRGNMICKRLDRVLYNEEWNDNMGDSMVKHMARTGSDHNLIIFNCKEVTNNFNSWIEEVQGNAMWILQKKLKKLSKVLTHWSKEVIGNVFEKVKQYEQLILELEHKMDSDDSEKNRQDLNRVNAEYIR
ncbi:uncharacterized protein LOC132637321 [Lycium barbarum]|uniref:uncharacterized protein LOC132637321 n=1 Tax=Lycium barbarum TaxID=112863 RepID=UPI00293F669F|nr:uncharacterized protein LOC132637321 [Lycium barbarum]